MAQSIKLNTICDQKYSVIIADPQYKDMLFEDPCFKTCSESIFLNEDTFLIDIYKRREEIKWLRPKEILKGKQPLFFKDGASFNEIVLPEGEDNILNAGFMNALAGMTLVPSVLNFVCPEQSFKDNYRGIFKFRFWRFGKWYEVVIDDRLPTLDGKLIFSKSRSEDEFWVPLVEKALAKLLTRYEAMDCTFEVPEALLDLSGGTVEVVPLAYDTSIDELRSKLKMYRKTGSLVTATISFGHSEDKGLKKESLYMVSGSVRKMLYDNNGVMTPANVVRILNTGRCEWTGAWGDESKEMKSLSADIKEQFGITSGHDGDFWMDLKDFVERFKELKVLHIPPELSEKERKWNVTQHFNKWQKGTTAMGSYEQNKENFHKNPQYTIEVDEDGDLVVVSLMAVGKGREETSWDGNFIGIDVYKTEQGQIVDDEFIHNNKPLHRFEHRRGLREISLSMVLEPGNYVIIPSTFDRDVDIPFLLRFFSGFSSATASVNGKSVYIPKLTEKLKLDPYMEEIIKAFFEEHAGKDGLMDNKELDSFFVAWKREEIIPTDIPTAVSAAIAALFDEDDSRMLSVDEGIAIGALSFFCDMMFRKADKDRSGSLDASELRDALSRAGLVTSDAVLHHLVSRYVGSDDKITFDEFFLIVSKLRYLIRRFERLGGSNEKSVVLSAEDMMEICAKL